MRRLCLHKNVLQAHTTGKPLGLAKNVRTLAYGLQDATVLSKGSPPGEEVEGTTKIAHTQVLCSTFGGHLTWPHPHRNENKLGTQGLACGENTMQLKKVRLRLY